MHVLTPRHATIRVRGAYGAVEAPEGKTRAVRLRLVPVAMRRALAMLVAGLCLLLGPAATTAAAAPVNDFPPEVVGNALVGERLLCGAGSWGGGVSKFSFAWLRDGIPIASGVAYKVRPEDEGHLLWCRVTATLEEFGKPPEVTQAESGNSVRIPGVLPSPPVSTEAPVLSGLAAVHEKLSCSNGNWSGSAPFTFTYQWVRDPGPEEALIEAASAPTYTVGFGDQGHALACRVTAHNNAGSASRLSNSLSVPGTKPEMRESPRVLGVEPASVGDMLACAPGEWSGSPRPQLTYQWLRDGVDITSATGSGYTIKVADELHRLSCTVTATNSVDSAKAPSSNSIRIRGSKPQNTEAPSVAGEPLVGNKLTCNGGTWSGAPAPTLSYLWVRNLGLVGEEAIASAAEYTIVAEDAGKALSCEVTARNSEGEATQSTAAKVVPKGGGTAPENVVPPMVAGEEKLGATLTCEAGTWSGSPEFTYQWLRDESTIPNGTKPTYKVEEADQAHKLKCRVTAINAEGSASRDSSNSKQIPGVAPKELEAPHVIGVGEVNEALTCLRGSWSGAPIPSIEIQWRRNGSAIGGAIEASYTVTGEDRGSSISCKVTASNSVGTAEAVSEGVQIRGNQPHNTVRPEVVGKKGVGDVLTCLPGSWSGQPPPAYTYQWLLEGSEIPTATGNTYTIVSADLGLVLSCKVTATNHDGSASAISEGVHIPGEKPENIEAPLVSGTTAVGAALKCGPGIWKGRPPPIFTYQWFRDATSIASANSSTYTVDLGDQGHAVSCEVTATNGDGRAAAKSAAVSIPQPVVAAESRPELPFAPSGPRTPNAAQIIAALGTQLARAQHHARIASVRKKGFYAFSLLAPVAGTLELSWYGAPAGAHRSAGAKPIVIALSITKFESATAKTIKLRLTSAGRRLLEHSYSLSLTLKGVFVGPQGSITWLKTVVLHY